MCRVSPARGEENLPVLSSEDSPSREGTTLWDKNLSTWKKFHTTLEEKGSLSHLPACHLSIPVLSMNLKDGEQNKLESNGSSLTHWRHWLQLDNKAEAEKQVLEHPTQPRHSYSLSNTALEALAHAVALAAFLSVQLLTPGFLKSNWDSACGSLSEEEAEGMRGTTPALTSPEQLCPLLTTEVQLLIDLVFWTQLAIVFLPDCPTVTPPLSYLEGNSNQGTPGHPEGMEERSRWVLIVISAPSPSHTTSRLPLSQKTPAREL